MIRLRDVPTSDDKLVDWVFKQFIFFLRRETLRIKRKKELRFPDSRHRKIISGLMVSDLDPAKKGVEITINTSPKIHENRDEEVETLIHELGHIVFWKTPERFICQLEEILISSFTHEQKNFLKSFLPKHEVKN